MRLTAEEWAIAQLPGVCTARQLEVLDWWRRDATWARIGYMLDLDPSTVKEHVQRGVRRIEREKAKRATEALA